MSDFNNKANNNLFDNEFDYSVMAEDDVTQRIMKNTRILHILTSCKGTFRSLQISSRYQKNQRRIDYNRN